MIVCCDYDATSDDVYERVARILAGYGSTLHTEAAASLPLVTTTDGAALKDVVLAALAANVRQPFFYFGHGRRHPLALIGRSEAVILDDGAWELLRGRVSCVTACHSVALGNELKKRGVSLLGYRGELQVFYEDTAAARMRAAALAGPKALLAGRTLAEAKAAATAAYDALAAEMYASVDFRVSVLGPFVEQNARAVDITGDARRTLQDV